MRRMDARDYAELAGFWRISLVNANLSAETIRSYLRGVTAFAAWCQARGGEPELTLRNAEAYTAGLLEAGQSASTATARQLAVRRFSAWLAALDPPEIPRDELAGLKAPKLDSKVVDALTPEQLRALIAACAGRRFVDVRDTAIVRFMADTGARADEVISLKVIDVQIEAGSAVIIRGKGGKGRRSGFGPKTAEALARYARARRRHPLAGRPEFWLAERRRVLNYQALYAELRRRAARAGIEGFHPHMLRHTAAVRWMKAGGSVTGLMSQGGWTDIALVQRYLGAAQADLAIEESHRLRLDDI
jgi:integrase/recombinase XerD